MKQYKYNLLGANIPPGYRFVRKNEMYLPADVWWRQDKGIIFYQTFGNFGNKCFHDFPTKSIFGGFVGWLRKIN